MPPGVAAGRRAFTAAPPPAAAQWTDEFRRTHDAAKSFAGDVTIFDTGTPGVDLFFCTVGGVPVEFMGAYAPEANSETSDATKD